jgi:NAD(P)-dependent dehydrogenase (short-subunit alcohol dehydrogenase family)
MSKTWLITGSSRGLGRAFTVAALEAGDKVVAGARKPEQLAELESRFDRNIRTISLDVTDEVQARKAVETAIETFGALDVLVNNAGYGNVSPIEDTSVQEFREQIETNLFGVIIMTKAVLPHFRTKTRTYYPGVIDRRADWSRRTSALCRGKIWSRRLFRVAFERGWTPWYQGDHPRTRWFPYGLRGLVHRTP